MTSEAGFTDAEIETMTDAVLAAAGKINNPKVQDDLQLSLARLYARRYVVATLEALPARMMVRPK